MTAVIMVWFVTLLFAVAPVSAGLLMAGLPVAVAGTGQFAGSPCPSHPDGAALHAMDGHHEAQSGADDRAHATPDGVKIDCQCDLFCHGALATVEICTIAALQGKPVVVGAAMPSSKGCSPAPLPRPPQA